MPRISIAAALLLAVGVMFTPSADAAVIATFDFVALASGNEGPADPSYSDGATVVTLTAGGGTPYLDDLSGGLPGGLGVCTAFEAGDPDECDPSNDDNLGLGEMVFLEFSGVPGAASYRILDISFTNADHEPIFGKDLGGFELDGGGFNPFAPGLQGADLVGISGTKFGFKAPIEFGNGSSQLYINSITVSALTPGGEEVPEPGTIGLMLIGLGMLAGGRKFRNRKNS